jgi:hypothetical protein
MIDCACGDGESHANLDEVKVLLDCVECGGFLMGIQGDLDTVIDTLVRLRETRFHGTVDRSGHRPVVHRVPA